MSQIGRRS